MNKRYIDFVPAKNSIPKGGMAKPKSIKVSAKTETPKPKPVKKVVRKIPAANPLLDEEVVVEEIFAERKESVKKSSNLQPKFVKTEVKKRPLGVRGMANKSAMVVKKPAGVSVAAGGAKVATTSKAMKTSVAAKVGVTGTASKKFAPLGQRTKFLNTDKIQKRALGRTASRVKPVPVPKIELAKKSKAPEKIIAKPEKDSKAGLIIAIILTIILGAAAGTVAFLLLPK